MKYILCSFSSFLPFFLFFLVFPLLAVFLLNVFFLPSKGSAFLGMAIVRWCLHTRPIKHTQRLMWFAVSGSVQIYIADIRSCRPRGLRHELFSPAQTLGSWVRIPLEAWMYVCIYSVCPVLCEARGLATGWSPSKDSYRLCIDKKLKKRPRFNQGL
jgi:hypothetical protein